MMYSSSSTPSPYCDDRKTGTSCFSSSSLPRPPRADIEAVLMSTLSSVLRRQHQLSPPSAALGGRQLLQWNPQTAASELLTYSVGTDREGGVPLDAISLFPPVMQSKFFPLLHAGGYEALYQRPYRYPSAAATTWQLNSPMVETKSHAPRMVVDSCGNVGNNLDQQDANSHISGDIDYLRTSTSGQLN